MLNQTRLFCCAFAFLVGAVSAVAEDNTIQMRFKFAPNELLVYETVTESTIITKYDEEEEQIENSTTARKQFRIVQVLPEGAADLEVMFQSVKMRYKVADNPAEEFDSSKDEEIERVDFRRIKESVGHPQAVLRFNSLGKLDEIVKVEEKEMPPHPEEFQTTLMTLPKEPVKVGTQWSEPFKVRVGLEDGKALTQEVALTRKYKIESIEGNLVKISMRTAVLTPIRSNYVAVQLSQREMNGEILFDNERGVILSRDLIAVKEIINAFGNKTLFNARSRHSEKLIEPERKQENAS